jgi:hypothetical protein
VGSTEAASFSRPKVLQRSFFSDDWFWLVSYGHPWAYYSGGYQDRLLGGPLGLPDLGYMALAGMDRKAYIGLVLG